MNKFSPANLITFSVVKLWTQTQPFYKTNGFIFL
jgi:hypothetical protein